MLLAFNTKTKSMTQTTRSKNITQRKPAAPCKNNAMKKQQVSNKYQMNLYHISRFQ